ncbi:MFS transporter [Flavobacterium sp. MMLR14_040]|uniref:MDR family MFS transporter n=1 Tax=Flavobacterium sp. MMLR14_040 TaxID=3093843 RepID=UPI0029907B44|nr:MFS transporter [Flavobacterium sp. MMLR14_040]MDW8848853.1 MFS transporter [Flavobacterium sp. MMLR14_040]
MLKTAFNHYINNFRGFSREIWILTLVTFINRAGTMVLPFLSKYLNEDLHFDLKDVSWIMVSFGLGSMLGSWLGGKLSDKIGFYKIMIFSLFTSGVSLFFVQYITSFWGLCVAMFVLMTIADMFRPAMFVSLGAYAKPENRTRALTLVRLAVNLGFAAGPALGGLIIMGIGYQGLFWVDGASCIISISIFALLVKEKKKAVHDDKIEIPTEIKSAFHDRIFLVFLFVSFITAMIFFQLFTTLPLYHHKKFGLSEFQTGLLMTLNGLLIFALEVPTVGFMERKGYSKIRIIILGSFIMALSFFLLLINTWAGVLVISMVCISIGEILTFPFSNAFALSRAPRGHEGRYMALYTMSFSLAHIVSSKVGFGIIDWQGYQTNWLFMACIGVIATFCCFWIRKALVDEKV